MFLKKKYGKNFFVLLIAMHSLLGFSVQPMSAKKANLAFFPEKTHPVPLVITLSVGPVWENANQSQTLNLTPEIEKKYAAKSSTKALADGEVFLGIQKLLLKKINGQIGFAFTTTSSAILSGDIWDDADSDFDNYTYQYKIQHMALGLKGKLLFDLGPVLTPWISANIGGGFNRAYHFTNTPTISQATVNPNFTSNTNTVFTYTVGFGIQHSFTPHWHLGLGYEFSDWGKTQLDSAPGQTSSNGLSLSHFYTNGCLLNLTYIT